MAFVDDTSSVEGRYKGNDYSKILSNINRNALETSLVYKKLKCDPSSSLGIYKENVKQCTDYDSGRKRSKSESYKFVNCTSNQTQSQRANRTRTFSGNRTMHDKAVNVYVMPENMPELLLDGYSRSKQNLKWSDHSDDTCCQPIASVPSVPQIQVIGDSDRNGSEIESCQRERSVGIKRMRDESPSLVSIEPLTNTKYSSPLKVQEKHTNSVNLEIQSVQNGLCRVQSRVFEEPPPEPPPNYSDTRVKSKRSKTFNTDCNAVLVDVSDENFQDVGENLVLDIDNSNDPKQKQVVSTDESDLLNGECEAVLESESELIQWNNGELHPSLRESLFPCVPPFIRFSSSDEKAVPFPIRIQKLLRWKLSTITPLVVRKVVSNSGYRMLRKSTFWGGTWGKHVKSVGFKTLFDYQKMNHFPGTFQIGRKDRLWKSLQKLMSKHGKDKFDLMPTTYVLPQDKRTLKLAWKKMDGREPWIIKPPASARGTGIKVVHKWSQIPDNTPLIVQKYISRPYLINETKFDLRLYVLVTSVNPLRIYLYDNGLVRFASVKYSTELNTLGDRYMHLTNYSINKLSSKYKQNEDATACQGHKWTLKTLWSYMKTELNVDVSKIWNRLIDLIIKTILSGEGPITNLIDANLGSRYNSYELFGIDVLFDVDLKPWLLEVNISPSLHSASPLDLAVKAPLVRDLMNIVGFQIPHSKKFTEKELCAEMGNVPENQLCFDSRLYTRVTSYSEKQKQYRFARKTREEYLETILEDLTPDDIRHLIQYEDELTQLGSFQRIFPTWKTHEYLQYLDNPKYYNLLFDAWETKYHKNRELGIRLLKTKCEKGVHLQVSKENLGSTKTCETLPKCRQQTQNNALSENTTYPKNSYLALKVKSASYLVKPRHRLQHTLVPNRTYLLRSRKVR